MGTDGNERRAHPRAPIELRVEYQRLNTFFADYTKNISKGGTFIRTKRALAVGTEFLFHLSAPSLGEPLAICGQVVWVVREGQPPPPGVEPNHEPGMGIRFIYDDEAQRHAVEARVEELMIRTLGVRVAHGLLGKDPPTDA
jgi:type IV pilus assembly protein PilZ